MTIWLAIVTQNSIEDAYNEYHIRYEGHASLISAKAEISEVRSRLMKDEKLPLDCYVYEADVPMYGHTPYNLDDMDFNFYRELTPEEKERRKILEKEIEEKINV